MRLRCNLLYLIMIVCYYAVSCSKHVYENTPEEISVNSFESISENNSITALENNPLLIFDEIKIYGLPKYISTRCPVKMEDMPTFCLWKINRQYDYVIELDDSTMAFLESKIADYENAGFIRIRIDFVFEDKILKQYGFDKKSYDEVFEYITKLLTKS